MLDEQLKYVIGLSLLEGVGPINAKQMIAYCGSAEAVFFEKKSGLMKIPGIGSYTASKVNHLVFDRAEKEIEFIRKNKIKSHFYLDSSYPQRLKYCDDSPLLLFSLGDFDFNPNRSIAIVGTRTPSDYGKTICEELVAGLKPFDVTIISGLAYGIDVCAHRKCVEQNITTLGVLAHGLDRIYPSSHRNLAEKMLHQGGLVTEFISQTNPDRENFPKRNRIVAGMAEAIIVIETGIKGGSVITAMLGNDYNRDVFAFPGRSTDERSAGCNRLIKMNRAAMIECAEDFVQLMGWQNESLKKQAVVQTKMFVELSATEEKILQLMEQKGKTALDLIALDLDKPVSQISTLLLTLEFKGLVKSYPGKIFGLN